jgi:hypothetical protein
VLENDDLEHHHPIVRRSPTRPLWDERKHTIEDRTKPFPFHQRIDAPEHMVGLGNPVKKEIGIEHSGRGAMLPGGHGVILTFTVIWFLISHNSGEFSEVPFGLRARASSIRARTSGRVSVRGPSKVIQGYPTRLLAGSPQQFRGIGQTLAQPSPRGGYQALIRGIEGVDEAT